jgi:hypothetical protein
VAALLPFWVGSSSKHDGFFFLSSNRLALHCTTSCQVNRFRKSAILLDKSGWQMVRVMWLLLLGLFGQYIHGCCSPKGCNDNQFFKRTMTIIDGKHLVQDFELGMLLVMHVKDAGNS